MNYTSFTWFTYIVWLICAFSGANDKEKDANGYLYKMSLFEGFALELKTPWSLSLIHMQVHFVYVTMATATAVRLTHT